MDMMILLALFIAILALAYFTYRNLVGLDGRLRKIENILQNAEVVSTSEPVHSNQVSSRPGGEYSAFVSPEYIAGWGGQGPVLTVEKEADADADENAEEKVVELVDEPEDVDVEEESNLDDDEKDDTVLDLELGQDVSTEESKKKDVMNSVDDILISMENDSRRRFAEGSSGGAGNESVSRGPKVSEMKDALKKANVPFSATAKKSDLQKLMEENHIQV